MCSSMNFPARNLHLVQMFPTSLMKIVTFFPDFSGQIPPHGRSADLHPTFAQALKALASPTLAKHFYLWKPPSRVARKISTPLMFEGLNHWKKNDQKKICGVFYYQTETCWMMLDVLPPSTAPINSHSPPISQAAANVGGIFCHGHGLTAGLGLSLQWMGICSQNVGFMQVSSDFMAGNLN